MANSIARQRGAAMVEMAVVISLFLTLVFGILEFAMAVFDWSRVVEATRAGARYAIVNDMECGLDASTYICPGSAPASCNAAAAPLLLAEMQKIMPTLTQDNVTITYACSTTGFSGGFKSPPQVLVETKDVKHKFVLPGLLGIEAQITIPAFATTRLGEDLDTPA